MISHPRNLHRARSWLGFAIPALILLAGCKASPSPIQPPRAASVTPAASLAADNPSATLPPPARVLTICQAQEPSSLFAFNDSSPAARNIREALYDGPADVVDFQRVAVILDQIPSLQNGAVTFTPVQVSPGAQIVDAGGNLVSLEEGVSFYPAGCQDASCTQVYAGSDPLQVDQMVVSFRLKPGLLWSDGESLTADDSQYAFELANQLYPRVRADLLDRTQSYRALDGQTTEWVGVPGYRDPRYTGFFFPPVPRHAWGVLPLDQLLTADQVNRTPLGWGPYIVEEWTSGDHISLRRNPNYFRSAEGLPKFDRLVFRFLPDGDEALTALLAGECDLVDETADLENQTERLLQLQEAGQAQVEFKNGTAWEHADFGIQPYSADGSQRALFFATKEVRQAIALCTDRQRMADELFFGQSQVPDTYVLPEHPLHNPEVKTYPHDAQAGAALLQAAGWFDHDSNASTPRLAQGVAGVAEGTPFVFTTLTSSDPENEKAAQIIQSSLAECGLQVNIQTSPAEGIFSPGPDGPIFGRKFDMAQFSWLSTLEPPCFLYMSDEIPGPYPDFPKGWGGANASGFSNLEYDQACRLARTSLPEMPAYQQAHSQAQAIFAEELPALPLYLHQKVVASRPDLCNLKFDSSSETTLWNIESFDYGETCPAQ